MVAKACQARGALVGVVPSAGPVLRELGNEEPRLKARLTAELPTANAALPHQRFSEIVRPNHKGYGKERQRRDLRNADDQEQHVRKD